MKHPILIKSLLQTCKQAADAILAIYQQGDLSVEHKSDDSPLTQADLASHRIINAALNSLTPDIAQLSEEACDIPFAERSQWPRYWCIDPLDGTKEFIQGNGEFTINIALIEHGQPILGIIYTPATHTAYWGSVEFGAWKQNHGEQPIQIRSRPLAQQLTVIGSRRHVSDSGENLLQPIEQRFEHIATKEMGSSLKMCLIAEGAADFYPRLFPTSEWDTAAAQAIVEAAGGILVAAKTLTPLTYNQRPSLINPDFVVCGDPQFPLEELVFSP